MNVVQRARMLWVTLVIIIILSGAFTYQVFIKTDACALDPLGYWTEGFQEQNGEFMCSCASFEQKSAFTFGSEDT